MMGVGAGFDFHAGTIKRAPVWIQKIGFEWLYRLLQDPKRLISRYFVTNIKFLWYLTIDYLFGKRV
jgi:exopolysaccharide biosynthesis WecB/TagA/CpsF family protein